LIDPGTVEVDSDSTNKTGVGRNVGPGSSESGSGFERTESNAAVQLAGVWSSSGASDLPLGEVEFRAREFVDDHASELVLRTSPRAVDFLLVIDESVDVLELVEVDEVQASIVVELSPVIASVQVVDSSVTGLHTSVEEDVESALDSARAVVQDQIADGVLEGSISSLSGRNANTEDELDGWSRVNHLEFNVSVVVGSGDGSDEDLFSALSVTEVDVEVLVIPSTNGVKSESQSD